MLWKLGTTTAPVSTTTEATTTTKVQFYEYKLKKILVSGFLYAFITQSKVINAYSCCKHFINDWIITSSEQVSCKYI